MVKHITNICFLWSDFSKLMQEEKLEPLQNRYDDPHVRRLNILYARKRKELQEKKKLKVNFTRIAILFVSNNCSYTRVLKLAVCCITS